MALRLQVLMAEPLLLGLRQLKLWKEKRVREREERKERLNSTMEQSGRKAMDVLLVPVRLHQHLLTAPLHLVELLLYTVQRQAVELTAQRSCSGFYRRFSSLSLPCFPFFVPGSLCGSFGVVLAVGVFFDAFYVGRLLPSRSIRVC